MTDARFSSFRIHPNLSEHKRQFDECHLVSKCCGSYTLLRLSRVRQATSLYPGCYKSVFKGLLDQIWWCWINRLSKIVSKDGRRNKCSAPYNSVGFLPSCSSRKTKWKDKESVHESTDTANLIPVQPKNQFLTATRSQKMCSRIVNKQTSKICSHWGRSNRYNNVVGNAALKST